MHRHLRIALAATFAAAVLGGAAACGSDNSSSSTTSAASTPATSAATTATTSTAAAAPATKGPTVAVTMGSPSEFSLTLAAPSVKAGSVTFTATNTGQMGHQMVVLKTPLAAAKLPLAADGTAKEVGRVGKIADLPAGTTKTLTLPLKAGHYVVLCNLPGHYAGGMRTDLTVTN